MKKFKRKSKAMKQEAMSHPRTKAMMQPVNCTDQEMVRVNRINAALKQLK